MEAMPLVRAVARVPCLGKGEGLCVDGIACGDLHTKAWMHGHLNASSMHVPRWAGHAKSIGDSTFRGSTGWLGSDASDAGA